MSAMNILIVDDQASARVMLRRILQEVAPECVLHDFDGPVSALDWCRHNRPDLIIIDYSMPEMDGMQFARVLRRTTEHLDTPVIVVTVVIDEALRINALEAGIDDILIKPVVPRELQARARRLLYHREQSLHLKNRVEQLEAQLSNTE